MAHPENHPSYRTFGSDEKQLETAKVRALWAIAAELNELNDDE